MTAPTNKPKPKKPLGGVAPNGPGVTPKTTTPQPGQAPSGQPVTPGTSVQPLNKPSSPPKATEDKSGNPKPKPQNPDTGKPAWWLNSLGREMLRRQPIYRRRGNYVEGDFDLPRGDRRYMAALGHLRDLAGTNYVGLATQSAVQRMEVRGFIFDGGGDYDADATAIWAANDMKLQANIIHQRAAKYGVAYALVSPPDVGEQWPCITAEDPRCAIVYKDPTRPTQALAGLRMWADDVTGYILAVVYLPEGAYAYVGPASATLVNLNIREIQERLFQGTSGIAGFKPAGFVANPPDCQKVALVEYVWKPETGLVPEGECGESAFRVQNRINQTVFDRMCITHYQAYKQRWASGLKLPKNKAAKGQRTAPFDPGLDMLWVTETTDAKFGEFEAADISQILEAVRDDIGTFAAITQTPAHYLMGSIANISGDTLTQVESGLVSKTEQRISSMSWSHEQVLKLCFAFLGDTEKATDVSMSSQWKDPQRQLLVDVSLAAFQFSQAGVPLPLIMKLAQVFTSDDILLAQQLVAEQQAQEAQMQQQQLEMQQSHEISMAKAGGGPGAKPGATGAKAVAQRSQAAKPKGPASKAPSKKPSN